MNPTGLIQENLPTSLTGIVSRPTNPRAELVSILEGLLPTSDKNEIDNELKKTSALCKQKLIKTKKKPTRCQSVKSKKLTVSEKKKLGVQKLPRVGLMYDDFRQIHQLWLAYMDEILSPVSRRRSRSGAKWEADEALQMRLCRAEFHGALVKVTRSDVACQVGVEGFIVLETRNTFQILTASNKLKIIPKRNVCLSFVAHNLFVTINCNHLCVKPHERSVKKWKNRPPFDL